MAEEGENTGREPGTPQPFFSGAPVESTAFYSEGRIGPGAQIGPFKLLGILGEGGYGIVYLAEQERPIRRRVALKVIKPGMDSKQVIARFEAERQALALLDHPNIAHVYDAGTTEAGRPYFAMEYVEGVPITEYCDREKLDLKERLRLFLQVCNAVQHAHQKAIIHRDLKPSNILVTAHDDKPFIKVIDFGIAKALAQPLTEQTLYTEQGQLIGTPDYMSPEQAEMDARGVDIRSDVYSLGVVLYELLTGVLPFDPDALRAGGVEHIRAVIRDEEPRTPSTRLTGQRDELAKIAQWRRTDPQALIRSLHRELEWIPLKAMRKESSRRYQSVSELAADIENYLRGAPLLAGPESVLYRARKFGQRHGAAVAAAAVVAASLLIGLIALTLMYSRAEKMRVIAEDSRQTTEVAQAAEAAQRQTAQMERDRALNAEQQAQKRLADLYEQQGRQLLRAGQLAEALVFLNEACQAEPRRLSLQFLIAEARHRYVASIPGTASLLTPWRVGGRDIIPTGFSVSPDRRLVALVGPERDAVYVFDTIDGHLRSRFPIQRPTGIAFTGDSAYIIVRAEASRDGHYRLWIAHLDTEEVRVDEIVPDPLRRIDDLCQLDATYRPDRERLRDVHRRVYLSSSNHWLAVPWLDIRSVATQVSLFDLTSRKQPATLIGFPFLALWMVFSPDNKTFSLLNYRQGPFYLWEIPSGTMRVSWEDESSCLSPGFVMSPDRQYGLHAGPDPWVGLFRGEEKISICWDSVWAGFSPKGDRFVTKQRGFATTDTKEGSPPPHILVQAGSEPHGSIDTEAPALLWNTSNGSLVAALPGSELANWHFTPDSALLVTEHASGELRVYQTESGSPISASEDQRVVDVHSDGQWALTRAGRSPSTVTAVNLRTGDAFDLPSHTPLDRDLSRGFLNVDQDRVFRWSHESQIELPCFNADGSRLITAEGLRQIRLQASTPAEANAWIRANVALRLDQGRLRSASSEEMLDAKVLHSTLTKGPQHGETLSLRLSAVISRYDRFVRAGQVEEAARLVVDMRSWLPSADNELYQRGQQICKDLASRYLKRGTRAERRGKYVQAVSDYEAVLLYDNACDEAYGRLAWLQVTRTDGPPRQARQAIARAREACRLSRWENPRHLATLAAAHAGAGEFDSAMEWQRKAIDLLSADDSSRWRANFEERLNLYRAGHPYTGKLFWNVPGEDLIAWWKLDDGGGGLAKDSSGNGRDGTLVGDPRWEVGEIRRGLLLSVAATGREYVRCGNDPAFKIEDAITVSGWMQVKEFRCRSEPIVAKGDNGWALRRWAGTDKMRFTLGLMDDERTAPPTTASVVGETGVEDGRWHHIVGTYDGAKMRLYVDGLLDGTVPASGSIRANDFELCIGQSAQNLLNRQWNGLIADVRVYDRALSSEEVIELFYSGEDSKNKTPSVRVPHSLCLKWPEDTVRVAASITDDGLPDGRDHLAVQWSQRGGSGLVKLLPSGNVADPRIVLPKPGAYELLLTVSDGELQTSDTVRVGVYSEDFNGLLARYTFDDQTARNSSSLEGLHGSVSDAAAIVTDPQRGSVLRLTGAGHVDCGADARFDLVPQLTVAAFIRINLPTVRNQPLITKWRSWGVRMHDEQGHIMLSCISVFTPRFDWDNVVSQTPVADGKWHHVAGVFDGRKLFLYVDGVLNESTVAGPGQAINVTAEPIRIGSDAMQLSAPSVVLIDDVQVYNRALSAEEVARLYAETK